MYIFCGHMYCAAIDISGMYCLMWVFLLHQLNMSKYPLIQYVTELKTILHVYVCK